MFSAEGSDRARRKNQNPDNSMDSPDPDAIKVEGLADLHDSPTYKGHLENGIYLFSNDLKVTPSLKIRQPETRHDTALAESLEEYLNKGYAVQDDDVFATFPIYAVPKKGSTKFRIVHDLRALNKFFVSPSFSLPSPSAPLI